MDTGNMAWLEGLAQLLGSKFTHVQKAHIRWHFGTEDWANETGNILFTVHRKRPDSLKYPPSMIEVWFPDHWPRKEFPCEYTNRGCSTTLKSSDEEVALALLKAYFLLDQEWINNPKIYKFDTEVKAEQVAISLLPWYRKERKNLKFVEGL